MRSQAEVSDSEDADIERAFVEEATLTSKGAIVSHDELAWHCCRQALCSFRGAVRNRAALSTAERQQLQLDAFCALRSELRPESR